MARLSLLLLFLATVAMTPAQEAATTPTLSIAPIFQDHMVLQRERTIALKGTAPLKSAVTVSFRSQEHPTEADSSGRWGVLMPSGEAGGPFELRVRAEDQEVVLRDVLVGEVWLASGQSNMEQSLSSTQDGHEALLRAAGDREFRILDLPRRAALEPREDLAGAKWDLATTDTLPNFSAVGTHFAVALRESQGVPVGVISNAWGGSPIQPWIPISSFGEDERWKRYEEQFAKAIADSLDPKVLARQKTRWEQVLKGKAPAKERGVAAGWHKLDFDDGAWPTVTMPGNVEESGHDVDGVFWLRRAFELTPEQATTTLTLALGRIDDYDVTYVNGRKVGAIPPGGTESAYLKPRSYTVPTRALRPGRNVVAVQVTDLISAGGPMVGPGENFGLLDTSGTLVQALAGEWAFEHETTLAPGEQPREEELRFLTPGALFLGLVAPLKEFPIRGVIWYQGESNTHEADIYADLLRLLIRGWRQAWHDPNMPFLVVQVAPYGAREMEPSGRATRAELREAQRQVSRDPELKNVGMAVITDYGNCDDLHPPLKKPVGDRLAQAARALAYEEDVPWRSPDVSGLQVLQEGLVMVIFSDAKDRLTSRDEPVRGFELAGEDGLWYEAQAEIVAENTVAVRSDAVPQPRRVRYGWRNCPDVNLFNGLGLPAVPFQADLPRP